MPDLDSADQAATRGDARSSADKTVDDRQVERNCLNCGCPLVGDFCHCCGQKAHVHRTIAAWWHDFLHSVLHLDGKFWRTLPMLAFKPGELTRRYSHGERAKFISPLALFLFSVFLMFAVFSLTGPNLADGMGIGQGLEEGLQEERDRLQRLERQKAGAAGDPVETAELDRRIASTRDDIAQLERLRDEGITSATFADSEPVEGGAWFQAIYAKAKQNPELLLYKVQANAYKFSWALIPISIPFVWVLFLHRRRYRREFTAYDHLVFVTYSIAFMSLALIIFVLLGTAGLTNDIVGIAFMLIPPLHMYRQLRGAYGLSRGSAIWRTAALLFFAMVALSLFVTLLLALGALG